MKKILWLLAMIFSLSHGVCQFGPCDQDVPVINIDLTGTPDSVWFQSGLFRDGSCCGYNSPPNQCIKFIVTLDPNAAGLSFDVTCGALPNNLEWQLMDPNQQSCDPILHPAGVPVCLNTPGPHTIIFCKPGGNDNCYQITSIPDPSVSPPQTINDGCSGSIVATGYDESTLTWTSISPGNAGDYDNYLDCVFGCDSVNVTAQPGYPPYVDFQLCGMPLGGCSQITVCDTARVYFVSSLEGEILPLVDTICYKSSGGYISVAGTGGSPPYTYTWSTGAVGDSIFVNSAGYYWVQIDDATNCPPAFDSIYLNIVPTFVSAEAGIDQIMCSSQAGVIMNGSVTTATGGIWSGGSGTWTPSSTDLNATYIPTASEITSGTLNLFLTSTGNQGCPAETDSVFIDFVELYSNIADSVMVSCFGGNDGTATVAVLGTPGPLTYSWNTVPVQTGNQAVGLTSGSYNVSITDTNSCTTVSTVVITEPDQITLQVDALNHTSCFGWCDGSALISGANGTPPYTYGWSNGANGPLLNNVCSGTYWGYITDANGCMDSVEVIITEPSLLQLNQVGLSNVSCAGACDGQIEVEGMGGTSPYSYSWSPVVHNDSLITGLCVGSYSALVQDANGCQANLAMNITEPSVIQMIVDSVNHVSCSGGNDGNAGISVVGGSGSYNVTWNTIPVQNGTVANNLEAGTYWAFVDDGNGCVDSVSVIINEPTPIVVSIPTSSMVSCFEGTDGSASVQAIGGTPIYTYSWNSIPAQNGMSLNNVTAGTYTVTVTDFLGCTGTSSILITEPTSISTSILNQSDVACNAGSDGSAEINVTGGVPNYNIEWNTTPVQTGINLFNVNAGTYSAFVEDANGCFDTIQVTIAEPPVMSLALSSTNANCGNSDGTSTVNVSGGTPGYTYSWNTSPIQTNSTANNLPTGNYQVTVEDNNGCIDSAEVFISDVVVLAQLNSSSNVTCFEGNDGSAVVSGTGGTAPYSYSWNTSPIITDSNATNLSAGSYTATITDNNGCQSSVSVVITESDPIINSFVVNDVLCNGTATGEAIAITSGQYPPYNYSWNTVPVQTDSNAVGLVEGWYSVTITDNLGCDTTGTVYVSEPVPMSVSITDITDVSCFGETNGEAVAEAQGGVGGYSYVWNSTPIQNEELADSLSSGAYLVIASDSNGCSAQSNVFISQPSQVELSVISSADVSCFGMNDGEANLLANGGTPGYIYLWHTIPVQFGITKTDLSAGNYLVSAIDQNGCVAFDTVSIGQPDPLTITIDSIVNVSCFGGNDGSLYSVAEGGTSPYNYSWNSIPVQMDSMAVGLEAGNYEVTTVDNNGCIASVSGVINEPSMLTGSVVNTTNPSCFGYNDGSAQVAGFGGSPGYSYSWNTVPVQNTSFAPGIESGNYTVVITDNNGCQSSLSVSLFDPQPVNVTAVSTNALCFGAANGTALASVTGGTGAYSYVWNSQPPQVTPQATGLLEGSYQVIVADSLGCSDSTSIYVGQPFPVDVSISSSADVPCAGGAGGMAVANGTGGVGSYTYTWSSSPIQVNDSLMNVPIGTYWVQVSDVNGCLDSTSVVIDEPDSLEVNLLNYNNISCYGLTDGSIEVYSIGGTGNYNYSWNTLPAQTTSSISNLAAGLYEVIATDDNGCTDTLNWNIIEPGQIQLSFSTDSVSCFGLNDGEATVDVQGGSAPFNYSWNTNPVQITPTAIWLVEGNYSVTVTDSSGCSNSASVVVGQPDSLLINIDSVLNVLCAGDNDGIAYSNVEGGTMSYNILWNNGQVGDSASNLVADFYTAYVTDANGCTNYVNTEIIEPDSLLIDVIDVMDETCPGAANGQVIVSVSGGVSPLITQWNTNPVQTDTIASGLVAGLYSFFVEDQNGCSNAVDVEVFTDSLAVTGIDLIATPNTLCSGDSVLLELIAPAGNYTYVWSPNVGSGAGPYNINPMDTTWFYVTVLDSCNNAYQDSVKVDVSPYPVIDLSPFSVADCPDILVEFEDANYEFGNTYLWNFGDGNYSTDSAVSYLYQQSGSYTVSLSVTNQYGCALTDSVVNLVEVYPVPNAVIYANPSQGSTIDPFIHFKDVGDGATTWSWDLGDGTQSSDSNFVHKYELEGTYSVSLMVSNDFGCVDSTQYTMEILPDWSVYIPNAFTPNGDGVNDVFAPDGEGIDWSSYEMHIFNRWGEEIFYSYKKEQPWQGITYLSTGIEGVLGTEAQMDSYVYKIKVRDIFGRDHWYTGHVSLIR